MICAPRGIYISSLAVPSSGPIPLQPYSLVIMSFAGNSLQYPLAGLFLYNPGIMHPILVIFLSLQYPLAGLFLYNWKSGNMVSEASNLAVPSSGPIPLQLIDGAANSRKLRLLQYPLAGLFLYNPVEPISFRTPLVACSTL